MSTVVARHARLATRGPACGQPSDCVSELCTGNLCACSASLNVLDDGSGANGTVGLPDLVMSEISPGNYIEVFNTTLAAIPLNAAPHWLCSPFAYAQLATLAPTTTVPAGGFATIPWPTSFTDVDAGGEVLLYASAAFNDNTQILDFSCWGVNPPRHAQSQAEAVGKWLGGMQRGAVVFGDSSQRIDDRGNGRGLHYDVGPDAE